MADTPTPPATTPPANPPASPPAAPAVDPVDRQRKREQRARSEKEVQERAERLATERAALVAEEERKRVATLLGLPDHSQKAFDDFAAKQKAAREAQMTDAQRMEERLKALEASGATTAQELAAARRELKKAQNALQQAERQREDAELERHLVDVAASKGLIDPKYANYLYGEHLRSLPEEQPATDPSAFFEGLKTTHGHLFAPKPVGAGPAPIARAPVNAPAPPAPPAATPPEAPADMMARNENGAYSMSKRDFNRRTQQKYGFTPSM